jgi:hypothetical protein
LDGRAVQLETCGASPRLVVDLGEGSVAVIDRRLGTDLEPLVEQLRQLEVRIR